MKIKENYSLRNHNTFGIDVNARYFAEIHSDQALIELLRHPLARKNQPLLVGEGSNILFTRDFDGLVIQMAIGGIQVVHEDNDYSLVKAGAGVQWHHLVMSCIKAGLGGLENLSLIPGTVGAAPIQNIGAYGIEVKDYIEEVRTYASATGKQRNFRNDECRFAYRDSVFKNSFKGQYIITQVVFRLTKNHILHTSYRALAEKLAEMRISEPTIASVSDAVIHIRKSKLPDPAEIGNAGSFFKNPVVSKSSYQDLQKSFAAIPGYPIDEKFFKIPAGWLIEQCGWKGKRFGDAGIHQKQALVLVNWRNATGQEILDLSKMIADSVKEKFNIRLEPEVNIL
jgi:UDP-N-acetylmuramate dehydrogenase